MMRFTRSLPPLIFPSAINDKLKARSRLGSHEEERGRGHDVYGCKLEQMTSEQGEKEKEKEKSERMRRANSY